MPRPTTNPVDTDNRQRQTVIGVRLLPAEMVAVQTLADQRQISRAELLRRALLRDLSESGCLA